MDSKSRDQLALALLIAAKVFGIAGLALGVTSYRMVGGALLAFDAVLLVAAVVLAVRNMRTSVAVETDQKEMLRKMVKEGTLAQYLRDIQTDSSNALEAAE